MDLRKAIRIALVFLFVFYISTLQIVYADDIELKSPKSPMKVEVIDEMEPDEEPVRVEQTEMEVTTLIEWKSIGECRITYYCPCCNDPRGSYQSSSGVTLYEGCVACSWLPIGTKIRINGQEFVVIDRCGTDAIDIFVDTDSCYCSQYGMYYAEVEVRDD